MKFKKNNKPDKTIKEILLKSSIPEETINKVFKELELEPEDTFELEKFDITDEKNVPDTPEEEITSSDTQESKDEENEPQQEEKSNKPTTETPEPKKDEKKELTREEDTFKPEEFEKLEKSEQGIFSKIIDKFKDKKETKQDDTEKEEPVELLNQRQISKQIAKLNKAIEDENINSAKLGGKIELLNQKNADTNEQIQNLLEKIGELRSTVLGRERMFNKLEEDFSVVKYTVNAFKPDNLDKRFNSVDADVLRIESKLEKLDTQTKLNEEKLKKYSDMMQKIQSFDNVIEKLERIKKTEETIKQLKTQIQRDTSRTEVMIQNISESVSKINKTSETSQSNQDSIKDISVTLSKIESKMEFLVKKEEFENIKNDVQVIKRTLFEKDFKN